MALFSSTQPSIRARILPRFPAQVLAGTGITITKSGNTYTFASTGTTPPGGAGTNLQYRVAGNFGGMSGTSWDDANRALVFAGNASITASRFVLDSGAINSQTGTTYTLLAGDNGKIVTLSNAAPITLTCPSGLAVSFSCLIIQLGVGQVTVIAGGGAILNSYQSLVSLAGQYATGVITQPTANSFILAGQTA